VAAAGRAPAAVAGVMGQRIFRSMLKFLERGERLVFRWSLRLAVICMALMACVSLYQVITRFVFEQPSTWSEVAARSLSIWMVYLGLAAALRTGVLIAVETLLKAVRGRLAQAMTVAVGGVSLGVLLIMLWYGVDMVIRARFQMLAGVVEPFTGQGSSIAWVYAAVPTGAALSIVAVIAHTASQVALLSPSRASTPEAPPRAGSGG
jgi:TRAP-type C4-dicarboxylate transport system permease small subunit